MSQAVDPIARRARARSAISLGAAFALFGVVFLGYDAPASQAAGGGGLLEAVFGGTHVPETYYGGYAPRFRVSPAPRRFSWAHHARRHDIQARRRVAERQQRPTRRPSPPAEQTHRGDAAPIQIISPSRNAVFHMPTQPAPIQQLGAPAGAKNRPAGCAKPCPALPQPQPIRQASAGPAANALYADRTLRPGDTVVTVEGLRILRAGSRFPFKAADFQSLAEVGRTLMSYRRSLAEIERALKTPDGR